MPSSFFSEWKRKNDAKADSFKSLPITLEFHLIIFLRIDICSCARSVIVTLLRTPVNRRGDEQNMERRRMIVMCERVPIKQAAQELGMSKAGCWGT